MAADGALFSTDWALRNLLEPAFPGFVEFNEHSTHDDVVRIEIIESDSPYLTGVLDSDDDPQWWPEGSSYPIKVLNKEQVRFLLTSRELGEKYGEKPVAVVFNFGKGEVVHLISHYFLQRAEFRNARHQRSAASYAAEKGVAFEEPMADTASDLSLYEVEAAVTRRGYSPTSLPTRSAGGSKNSDAGNRSQDQMAASKGPDPAVRTAGVADCVAGKKPESAWLCHSPFTQTTEFMKRS